MNTATFVSNMKKLVHESISKSQMLQSIQQVYQYPDDKIKVYQFFRNLVQYAEWQVLSSPQHGVLIPSKILSEELAEETKEEYCLVSQSEKQRLFLYCPQMPDEEWKSKFLIPSIANNRLDLEMKHVENESVALFVQQYMDSLHEIYINFGFSQQKEQFLFLKPYFESILQWHQIIQLELSIFKWKQFIQYAEMVQNEEEQEQIFSEWTTVLQQLFQFDAFYVFVVPSTQETTTNNSPSANQTMPPLPSPTSSKASHTLLSINTSTTQGEIVPIFTALDHMTNPAFQKVVQQHKASMRRVSGKFIFEKLYQHYLSKGTIQGIIFNYMSLQQNQVNKETSFQMDVIPFLMQHAKELGILETKTSKITEKQE